MGPTAGLGVLRRENFTTLNKCFSVCLAPRTPYKELLILWTPHTQLAVTVGSKITISANNTQIII